MAKNNSGLDVGVWWIFAVLVLVGGVLVLVGCGYVSFGGVPLKPQTHQPASIFIGPAPSEDPGDRILREAWVKVKRWATVNPAK